jgi:uncharacterized protein HemX/uroporphyrinogen-III synthase
MLTHALNVMVTRPPPAGAALCQEIVAAGGHAIYFPTLAFLPPVHPELLPQQLAELDQYDWLIFISPQAVYASQAAIHASWPVFPAEVKIAAVGRGTAVALQSANLPVTVYPHTQWSSDGLLDLPEFQALTGKKIALFRGEGGREWLAENLTARGASLAPIIVYQRALPDVVVTDYVALVQTHKIDLVVCTSSEGLQNLKTLLQAAWLELQTIAVIVISERMRIFAAELGFHKIFLAKNPSHGAIMEVLTQLSLARRISANANQKGSCMANQADDNLLAENSDSITKPTKRHCSLWLNIGILCSAFAFVVLITAYYIGYNRLIQSNQDLAVLTTGLNSKIAQDQTDIAALQKTVADSSQQTQAALTGQQQVIGELKSTQQGKKESWSVSEAQYLTNLANDNLQVGDNIALVISLLQTADQKMRDLADANVLPVRKALAADIAALQAVPAVDLAGVYADVLALNSQVDKLPLPNKRPATDQAATDNAGTQKLSWWQSGLHQSFEVLRKIVVVRYNKPGERPFIPPDQQDFLYQNLHATFEQALSAVVHRQPEIYRASLQQGAAWIQQYFLTDSPVTQAELSSITKLQAVTLRPELPNISASLQAFHDYFAQSDAAGKSTEAPAT